MSISTVPATDDQRQEYACPFVPINDLRRILEDLAGYLASPGREPGTQRDQQTLETFVGDALAQVELLHEP